MIEAGFDHPEAQSDCPIAFTYTRKEINDLLEPADSKVISIEQDHIFPYVIEKYLRCELRSCRGSPPCRSTCSARWNAASAHMR